MFYGGVALFHHLGYCCFFVNYNQTISDHWQRADSSAHCPTHEANLNPGQKATRKKATLKTAKT